MYKLSSSQTRNSPLYLEPCSEAPFMKFGRNKHVIETTEVKADIPSQVSHKMCLQLSPSLHEPESSLGWSKTGIRVASLRQGLKQNVVPVNSADIAVSEKL